jgi:hypothetical protein
MRKDHKDEGGPGRSIASARITKHEKGSQRYWRLRKDHCIRKDHIKHEKGSASMKKDQQG